MAAVEELAAALVYGFVQGSLLGAVAAGLSLIWGVMKIVNLAHGELVVLGAYLAILFSRVWGVDPTLSPLLDFIVGGVLGLAIFYLILFKLVGRAETITLREEMATLLAMFGLSIFLFKLFYIWTDVDPHLELYETVPSTGVLAGARSINILGVTVEVSKLYVLVAAYAAVFLVHLFLTRTVTGLAIRAVTQDAVAVALVGINPVQVRAVATLVGIGLTVFSGGLVALYHGSGISPELAPIYAPLSFVIVVLGTPGNLWGAMAAGIIIGEAYNIVYAVTGSLSLGLFSAFAILVAALALRPEGLFARR